MGPALHNILLPARLCGYVSMFIMNMVKFTSRDHMFFFAKSDSATGLQSRIRFLADVPVLVTQGGFDADPTLWHVTI